jgi:hypothetical protein
MNYNNPRRTNTILSANISNSLTQRSTSSNLNSSRKSSNDNKSDHIQSQLSDLIQTQAKIPHPPPQSTRPVSSRKIIRGTPSAKTNQISANNNNMNNTKNTNITETTTDPKSNTLSNRQNNLNTTDLDESLNEMILALKSNNSKSVFTSNNINPINNEGSSKFLNYNEITNLDDSSSTIVYTFSSKPKPVQSIKENIPISSNQNFYNLNNINNNKTPKTASNYDHRKYASNNAFQTSNEAVQFYNQSNYSMVNDSLNPIQINHNAMMDSFEARMLEEMKLEMESLNHHSSNHGSKTSTNNNSKEDLDVKSPDIAYIQDALQRESSGLQTPVSDRTTSEKYNFDAITSSIEETTNSFSKKITNKNNYQEEMNFSLASNLPAKSINLK